MTENQKKFENLPAESLAPLPVMVSDSLFFDTARFELAQRVAKVFATSNMVPQQFQGNIGNCLIALNLADRMKCDPFMLLQNMYIVHGKPGIEAKLAIALVNNTGKFTPLQYQYDTNKTECYAHARRTGSGEECRGTTVSLAMAQAEGWMSKSGSKWKTMPELMLMYRAAMFFARAYCPEALLGMQTREELYDVGAVDMVSTNGGSYAPEPTTEDLTAKIMSSIVKVGGENLGDLTPLTPKPTITPEKFPAVGAPLPPDTKIVESKLPDAPEKLWYDTSLWIKTKTTGFTAFCIDNADKFDGIPEGAVCVYKGRSMRVIDAMREKWYGVNEGQHFPGDPDPEPEIKTEVVYDPRDDAPPAAEEPAPDNGESVALNPAYHRQMNLRLKNDFPLEWDQARADLGFGMLAASEEAAERWNAKVSVMLDAQDNGK